MLKKSFAFGLLAAGMMIAPGAAFAGDQVAGSTSVTNQSTVNNGAHNVSGQTANTNTVQQQIQNSLCKKPTGNQVAGATSSTGQGALNNGFGNVSGQSSSTNTAQQQVADAQAKLCGYYK